MGVINIHIARITLSFVHQKGGKSEKGSENGAQNVGWVDSFPGNLLMKEG